MNRASRPALSTRERLIINAERLFAQRGISKVSLREVGAAAGQRNASATQYHFGDKTSLLEAIFAYRMTTINERRMRHLAEMRVDGGRDELRPLLEAFVFPLAASTTEAESYYARFLAQFAADPHYHPSWDWETATSLRLVWTGFRRCLSHLPESTVRARLRMLEHLVVHTVADHEPDAGGTDHRASWAVELVDAAEGMLSAGTTA